MNYLKYIFSLLFLISNFVFAQKFTFYKRKNLEIVSVKEKQGVLNIKTKKFVIKPDYDEIYLDFEAIGKYDCREKSKTRSFIIDSNFKLYDVIKSTTYKSYEVVSNSKNKKGIYNCSLGLFLTKVEFDTILLISIYIPWFEKPRSSHSWPSPNFKPNQDLYAILGKNNNYHLYNIEQNRLDTSAYIIYIKRNDEAFDNSDHRYKKDSKFLVINLPDSNYEFDSTFYLFNSIKVNAINSDIVKHHNKYGLYTYEEGNFYLPIEYDSIIPEKNYYKTFKDGKLGYARRFYNYERYAGVMSNYNYTIITGDSNFEKVVDFDQQDYLVKTNGKWEFRNYNNHGVKYDSICIIGRKVLLKKDGKWDLFEYRNTRTRNALTEGFYKRKTPDSWNELKTFLFAPYRYRSTRFIWDSIAPIDEWHSIAKLNNYIFILDRRFIQIKIKSKKVNEVCSEKMPHFYEDYSSEKINGHYEVIKNKKKGEFHFISIQINKNPLVKKPYKVKMYLQGNKLVKQPNFKESKYALLRNYLRACSRARQENRKMKK